MKKMLFIGFLLINLINTQAIAQCENTHLLCEKQLSKEDKRAGWSMNHQSQSVSFEKGKIYEMDLTAYKGMEYRLSVCTDIDGGTPAQFQLAQDVMVTVKDSSGNTSIKRQREIIFDSTVDSTELYVLFKSNKTEKFYLSVSIPTAGKSKKLKNTDFVCMGVLLENRKTKKSAL